MVIVLQKAPWATFREAVLRLAYRNVGYAIFVVASGLTIAIVTAALALGPAVGSIYLAEAKGVLRVVLAAVLALVGLGLAAWFWRRASPIVLRTAWLLVEAATPADRDNSARMTQYERQAVRNLRAALDEVAELVGRARIKPDLFSQARERWTKSYHQERSVLSRTNTVLDRLELVHDVLNDGAQHPGEGGRIRARPE